MKNEEKNSLRNREGEKGAAMVMALLVSFLLLIASAGLIMEASMNTANVTDAISEQEAYHAAESGIQSAVHVLRCEKNSNPGCHDVRANPLLNTATGVTATDPPNQITYNRALDPVTSNRPDQQGSSEPRRLSRWMNYDDTCGPTLVSCVSLNNNEYGFALSVSDPDNTSKWVSFSMDGRFYESDCDDNCRTNDSPAVRRAKERRKTYVDAVSGNSLTVTYTPPAAVVDHDMSGGAMDTPYGTFSFTGGGVKIPADNRFEIVVGMTKPFDAVKSVRGWIMATGSATETPKVLFDSQTLTLVGSALTLDLSAAPSSGWSGIDLLTDPATPPGGKVGYRATPSIGNNVVGGSISPPEPVRLRIRSTGWGPRGAKKELEAIIQKNFFNGLTAPAALTLVGPHKTGPAGIPVANPSDPVSQFYFSLGTSSVLQYSGADQVSTDIIPPIGTSNPVSLDCVEDFILNVKPAAAHCVGSYPNGATPFNGTVVGSPSDVTMEMPYWLKTPQALDREIHKLAATAKTSGRFYASGETPTTLGDFAAGTGITFCDGNLEIDPNTTGDGGGILVVTGSLTIKGGIKFKGLIIVTGADGVLRSGGGGGGDAEITGNVVVAPYVNSKIVDRVITGNPPQLIDDPAGIFLAPHYNMDGGGNSNLQFNSASLKSGLTAVSNFVLGVVEK